MKTNNCKDVKRQIEEADSGEQLGGFAAMHVRECAECQSFHHERRRLRQLIAGIGTVKAPADFDLRLRTRIAQGKAAPSLSSSWRNGLRLNAYSALLAALLFLVAVAGLLVFRGSGGKAPDSASVQPDFDASKIAVESGLKSGQPSPESSSKPQNETILARRNEPAKNPTQSDKSRPLTTSRTSGFHATLSASVRRNRNTATREFGSLPAEVVNAENSMADIRSFSVFPVRAASQSLKVSLDDGRGGARTISLPTVSFGSQQMFVGGDLPLSTANAKGIW